MPFRPYHCFTSRAKLERLVTDLKSSNNITDAALNDFYRYHPTMIHKLKSAKFHLEALSDTLNTTDVQEALAATSDFMFQVNMFIDGFFYNAGSSLDILARVVLALFGEPLTGNIYFQTAHDRLAQSRPGDLILPRIAPPHWRAEFSDYRNALTHELILARTFHINIDNSGPVPLTRIVFPLPDEPRAEPDLRSFRRNPDVVEYARRQFARVLRLANTVYGDIVVRVTAAGHLPI